MTMLDYVLLQFPAGRALIEHDFQVMFKLNLKVENIVYVYRLISHTMHQRLFSLEPIDFKASFNLSGHDRENSLV